MEDILFQTSFLGHTQCVMCVQLRNDTSAFYFKKKRFDQNLERGWASLSFNNNMIIYHVLK